MELYVQHLTFGLVAFYTVFAILISGAVSLLAKGLAWLIFERMIKVKWVFIIVALIILVVFITLVILDESYSGEGIIVKRN